MGLLGKLRQQLNPLLQSAADPRVSVADLGERQRKLLERVQETRASAAAARRVLEAKIAAARGVMERIVAPPGGSEPAASAAVRDLVAHDLHALEEELRALDRDERALPGLELRLRSELDALRVRQDVADARASTRATQSRLREALDGIAGELSILSETLERAERRAGGGDGAHVERSQSDIATDAGATARWLARRFEIELRDRRMSGLRSELADGRLAAGRLALEWERLLPTLAPRHPSEPLALASLPTLADQSYRQGAAALEAALELARSARPESSERQVSSSVPEGMTAVRQQAAGLIQQARGSADALERARLELGTISASRSGDAVEAATRTLLAALDRAKAVHEQLSTNAAERGERARHAGVSPAQLKGERDGDDSGAERDASRHS